MEVKLSLTEEQHMMHSIICNHKKKKAFVFQHVNIQVQLLLDFSSYKQIQ